MQPGQSLIFPAQISETHGQGQRHQNQKNFSRTAASVFLLIFEQVIKIPRTRVRIGAQAGPFAGRRIVQSQKGRAADGGRILGHWR
jgi:hypothetical protein